MQKFLIRRDPRLHFTMLVPIPGEVSAPVPANAQRCFTFTSGRYALFHGLKVMGIGAGDQVLVPAYHCSAAIAPITAVGANPCFYDVNEDLSLNLSAIEAQIGTHTKAIMGVHYFGYPQPLKELRALCNAHGVFLIENCAHILDGQVEGAVLGTIGDISVFSWRKYLPLYDGGMLVLNKPGLVLDLRRDQLGPLAKAKSLKAIVEKLFDDCPSTCVQGNVSLAGWSAGGVRRVTKRIGDQTSKVSVPEGKSVDFNPGLANREMSEISQFVLRHLNLQEVANARRQNARALAQALSGMRGVTLLKPELAEEVCPLAFPVIVRGRPRFHVQLRSRGIPAFGWEGVVSQEINLVDFPHAEYLFEHLFFLPLHQSLSRADLGLMIDVFTEALNECGEPIVSHT